jgi:hypothetical protein
MITISHDLFHCLDKILARRFLKHRKCLLNVTTLLSCGHTERYVRHARYVRYVRYTNRKVYPFIDNVIGHTQRYVRRARYVRDSVWPVTFIYIKVNVCVCVCVYSGITTFR